MEGWTPPVFATTLDELNERKGKKQPFAHLRTFKGIWRIFLLVDITDNQFIAKTAFDWTLL
jgi:hypothetical protein